MNQSIFRFLKRCCSNMKTKQDKANQESLPNATPPRDKDFKTRSTPCGLIIPAVCISVACEAESFLLKEKKKNLSTI